MIDKVALWLGYAVMIAGGTGLALGALWLAAEGVWRWWINGMNLGEIMEATEAWRRANPEKFARWKKRNGVDESG